MAPTTRDWRPDYPVKYSPLFTSPHSFFSISRITSILKYFFGYPSFFLPWNAIWVAITFATYLYWQPATSAFSDLFSAEGKQAILQVLARNAILLTVVSHGWHLILYTFEMQGMKKKYTQEWYPTNDSKFTFNNQLYDNIFWSLFSGVPIWSAYEIAYFYCAAHGLVPTLEWSADTSTRIQFVLTWFMIPFWREFHFYVFHRAMHHPAVYRYIHALHHRNVNPISWSGMSMAPPEHLLYFSVVLLHWIVPTHPLIFLYNSQNTALTPAGGHHGFEGPIVNDTIPTGSYFHWLHHSKLDCNFGESTLPLDYWFGTFNDGMGGASLKGMKGGAAVETTSDPSPQAAPTSSKSGKKKQ